MNWQKRYLRISLFLNGKLKNILTEDLAVTFNTSEAVSGGLNETNIVINGLKPDTMFYLATANTQWTTNWQMNRITIDAGFYNNHGIVFDGVIMEAKPNFASADYSISIKALSMFAELVNPKSYAFVGDVPVNTIAKQFADDLGLTFESNISNNAVVNNFNLRDQSTIEGIRNLSATTGLDIFESRGRLYVKNPDEGIKQGGQIVINTADIVGIPEPTPTGVKINVRMNPSYRSGQRVKVVSKRFPQLQSYNFFIMVISNSGATKGQEWITHLQLVKEGMGFWQ